MTVVDSEAMEVFNGVMLGDGGLIHQSGMTHLQMRLSGHKAGILPESLLEYLTYLSNMFKTIGIEPCTGHPKIMEFNAYTKSGRQKRLSALLITRTSTFLDEQFKLWYVLQSTGDDGKVRAVKTVPRSLDLTPIVAAHWFAGDGSSRKDSRKLHVVSTSFATHGFNNDDVRLLRWKLIKLGINNTSNKSGIMVRQDSVDRLMKLVEPYMPSCYRYKIKYK